MNINLQDMREGAEAAARFLKTLGNMHRLMILCELHTGERSVTALERTLGLPQPLLSQHLARLREERVVRTRREARTVYYSCGDPDVARIIAVLYARFCARQDAPRARTSQARGLNSGKLANSAVGVPAAETGAQLSAVRGSQGDD